MSNCEEELTVFLNSLFVLLDSIGPLLPLFNLHIFILNISLFNDLQLVFFEFSEVFLNNLVPFFLVWDQLLCGVDMVNCYLFLVLQNLGA